MTFCPWNGERDCGCTSFPFAWNGQMPARCQELMPFSMMNAHLDRLSPEKLAQYKAWAKMPEPQIGPVRQSQKTIARRQRDEAKVERKTKVALRGMHQLKAARRAAELMQKREESDQ